MRGHVLPFEAGEIAEGVVGGGLDAAGQMQIVEPGASFGDLPLEVGCGMEQMPFQGSQGWVCHVWVS